MTTAAATAPDRLSPWAPLRHKVFAALFAAQLGSNIGTFFQSVAAAWLMGDITSSVTLVALVQTAALLPVLLFGIPSGAMADIVDRRRLLLGAQLWMLLAAGALAALTFTEHITPSSLLTLTFALGMGSALMGPAWQAIQPDLVPPHEFGQAVALSSLTFNTGRAIGPALGGALVATAGAGWAFVVNACSFLGVLIVLALWRPHRTAAGEMVENLPDAMRAGLRYSANSPLLRGVLVRTFAFAFPAAAIQALLPTVVRQSLGMGSGAYGVLLGAFGIGAASSVIVRPRVEQHLNPDGLVAYPSLIVAGSLVVIGVVHNVWATGIALFIAGMAWTTATVTTNVSAQRVLPWWVRARGLALYIITISGGVAGGAAVWGSVAGISLLGAHLAAAATLVVGATTVFRWRLSSVTNFDLRQGNVNEPIVSLSPAPDDGPVLVTVTYRVPEAHHGAFATMMERFERERRRSGARQWGLFRDLVETDRFVETFVVDSWAEHLRQHTRRTVAADVLHAEIRDFVEDEIQVAHLISAYSEGGLRSAQSPGARMDG